MSPRTSIAGEVGLDMTRFPTASHLISVGRTLPAPRRERRQAPLASDPQGGPVAEDHAGQRCVGSREDQGHLPAGPVSAPARPAWRQEGDHRGRRFDAYRRVDRILRARSRTKTSAPSTSPAATRSTPHVVCSADSKISDSPSKSVPRALGFLCGIAGSGIGNQRASA